MDFNNSYFLGKDGICDICQTKEIMNYGCINYSLCGCFICNICKDAFGFYICKKCEQYPNLYKLFKKTDEIK